MQSLLKFKVSPAVRILATSLARSQVTGRRSRSASRSSARPRQRPTTVVNWLNCTVVEGPDKLEYAQKGLQTVNLVLAADPTNEKARLSAELGHHFVGQQLAA